MGLEKLLRSLYGSPMQIDLDQKLARTRVIKPAAIDFFAIGDGVIRNNMGIRDDGITIDVAAAIADGKVVLQPTGQTFRLQGPPPHEKGHGLRRLRIVNWHDRTAPALTVVR